MTITTNSQSSPSSESGANSSPLSSSAFYWANLSYNDKRAHILQLSQIRDDLLKQAARTRATKRRKKSSTKSVPKFKSKELEELFHKLPANIQSFILGGD